MTDFYSSIAPIFRSLRKTDSEPVLYIKEKLEKLEKIEAADVGAGAGRYAKLFFDHLGRERLFLHCFDINEFMLTSLEEYLKDNGISNFVTTIASAEEIPLDNQSLDCIFSFNSIHHFHPYKFFNECLRVLKPGGQIFIYTRTRKQNASSVWGRFFPLFNKKESRLFEPDELKFKVSKVEKLDLVESKKFIFERNNTIIELVDRASSRHYSTFFLYDDEEFELALKMFEGNLKGSFDDINNISWIDEKILYVIRKKF